MNISLRLSDEDSALIKKYAELKNMSVSELNRRTMLERIEDEFDLRAYDEAMRDYLAEPKTFSLDEIEKIIYK